MTQSASQQPKSDRFGTPFGLRLEGLGWFTSLLMGVAAGFAAFFATTFLAIMSMLAYIMVTGKPANSVDFSMTYRDFGLPVGATVMAIALAYLGTLWARSHIRRA
jgi:hypothetical protein